MSYYYGLSRMFERISLAIWKMRNFDAIVSGLEQDLDKAQAENARLREKIMQLQKITLRSQNTEGRK